MADKIAAAYLKALQEVFLVVSERMFCGAARGIFWRPQENLFGGLAKHLFGTSLFIDNAVILFTNQTNYTENYIWKS